MTIEEALADLTRKTDPCQARCLRCCARLRVVLRLIAASPLNYIEAQWEDTDIDTEVAGILEEYPDLVGRYEQCGAPRATPCKHNTPAPSWSRDVAVAGFAGAV